MRQENGSQEYETAEKEAGMRSFGRLPLQVRYESLVFLVRLIVRDLSGSLWAARSRTDYVEKETQNDSGDKRIVWSDGVGFLLGPGRDATNRGAERSPGESVNRL